MRRGGTSRTVTKLDGNKYISLNLLWLCGSLLGLKGGCTMCTFSFFMGVQFIGMLSLRFGDILRTF